MTRFPWACGKLPQASPSGILPIMYIPQESRHFQDPIPMDGGTKPSLHDHKGSAFEKPVPSVFERYFSWFNRMRV
ncbi:hypothetical protein [Halobacillus sp. K22]|uniref:hypothetical protein n=1 Tax=Halobacillus sp. K22 TaxID=3457431 RepID=UPI003FCCB43F